MAASLSAAKVAGLVRGWASKVPSAQIARSFSAPASHGGANHQEQGRLRVSDLSDEVCLRLLKAGQLSPHSLEVILDDPARAVELRRAYFASQIQRSGLPLTAVPQEAFGRLPSASFDYGAFYGTILNTNCESVVGWVSDRPSSV